MADLFLLAVEAPAAKLTEFSGLSPVMQWTIILVPPFLTFLLGIMPYLMQLLKRRSLPKAHSDESYHKDAEIYKLTYALRDTYLGLRCSVFLLHNGGTWFADLRTDWNHKKKITCQYEAPDPQAKQRPVSLDFNDRLVNGTIFDWINRLRQANDGTEYVADIDQHPCTGLRTMCGMYGTKSSVSVLVRDESGHPTSIISLDFAEPRELTPYTVACITAEAARIGRLLHSSGKLQHV